MRKEKFIRLLIPIGLLMVTLVTRRLMHVPEFVEDFFKGLGITLMIGSMILQKRKQPVSCK
ncbi:MAG: hypothetical protein JWN76_1755 [Chitinophagaceae bacterium]|nr:hypothetical protein [Chitinophagaceae bacterium]